MRRWLEHWPWLMTAAVCIAAAAALFIWASRSAGAQQARCIAKGGVYYEARGVWGGRHLLCLRPNAVIRID